MFFRKSSLIAVLVLAPAALAATDRDRAIVPGTAIGHIRLGQPLPKSLGEPTNGDGAMGRYEATYVARGAPHYRLDILSRRISTGNADERVEVKTIRVESPYFRTAGGVSPQQPWRTIRRQYPAVEPIERWRHRENGRWISCTIYDAAKSGIAFEVADRAGRCRAIYVHTPGEPWEVCGKYTDDWQRVVSPRP